VSSSLAPVGAFLSCFDLNIAHAIVPIIKPRIPPVKKSAMQTIGKNMGPPASPVARQLQIKRTGDKMLPVNVPTRANTRHLYFRCFCGSDEMVDISVFISKDA
jgi:hypothetical protein